MSPWVKVRREGGETPEGTPLVTIRRSGVAFNAAFVRVADLEDKTRVSVHIEPESWRIGFKFLSDPSDVDSYALTRDGGGRGKGRWTQAGALVKLPWVAAVARLDNERLRRFKPTWSSAESMWSISLCPAFETRVRAGSEVPSNARGIYRYRRGDEVVYIGRGEIRSRLTSPNRKEWDFDTIEYSLINDERLEQHWEAYWLDRFAEEYGKLPIYNRIGGTSRPLPEYRRPPWNCWLGGPGRPSPRPLVRLVLGSVPLLVELLPEPIRERCRHDPAALDQINEVFPVKAPLSSAILHRGIG
jgi:hypothetical protein